MTDCAELTKPPTLTRNTMNAVVLSTYERKVGTVVTPSCLMPEAYVLNSTGVITCKSDGTWDKELTTCVVDPGFLERNTLTTTLKPDTPAAAAASLDSLQIIGIVLGVFAFVIIVITIVVLCRWRRRRRQRMEQEKILGGRKNSNAYHPQYLQPWEQPKEERDYWQPGAMHPNYKADTSAPAYYTQARSIPDVSGFQPESRTPPSQMDRTPLSQMDRTPPSPMDMVTPSFYSRSVSDIPNVLTYSNVIPKAHLKYPDSGADY